MLLHKVIQRFIRQWNDLIPLRCESGTVHLLLLFRSTEPPHYGYIYSNRASGCPSPSYTMMGRFDDSKGSIFNVTLTLCPVTPPLLLYINHIPPFLVWVNIIVTFYIIIDRKCFPFWVGVSTILQTTFSVRKFVDPGLNLKSNYGVSRNLVYHVQVGTSPVNKTGDQKEYS